MPDEQDGRGRPLNERTAARNARRKWADEVTRALDERRLSVNAAAKEIGISPGRLQAWLGQDVEPSPRVMGELASVVGRGHLYLLQILEWLPVELGDIPLRLEADERLRNALDDARRWVQAAAGGNAGSDAAARIARAVLEDRDDWEVQMRVSLRGRRHRVRYGTHLGFRRPGPRPVRAELDRLIRGAGHGVPTRWLEPDELGVHPWSDWTQDVLSVPGLRADRVAGVHPNLAVPPSLAVIGLSSSGVRQVAALLADLLDWSFLDVAETARERFDLTSQSHPEAARRAETSVAQRLFREPATVGRFTVWSYSDPDSLIETFREIGPDLPLVLVLEPSRQELADDDGSARTEAALHVVRSVVRDKRPPSTYRFLEVPPPQPVDPSGDDPSGADARLDVAVDLALDAARWIADEHGGPPLDTAPTMLGTLARRAAGQPA